MATEENTVAKKILERPVSQAIHKKATLYKKVENKQKEGN